MADWQSTLGNVGAAFAITVEPTLFHLIVKVLSK